MAPRAKRGRGEASTSTGRQARVASLPEFPNVVFKDQEQKTTFLHLGKKEMHATRFLDESTMRNVGLHRTMVSLFSGTGLRSFYGMCENSYRALTLEFLSSFEYDKKSSFVAFRLLNIDYRMTTLRLGELFGMSWNSSEKAPELDDSALWQCIAGTRWPGSSALRTNEIPHPGLRLWFRTVIGTLFARNEKGTLTMVELRILGHYLLNRHSTISPMDLPGLLALHFKKLVIGKRTSIEVGGLITFLAKKLGNFVDTDHTPLMEEVPLIDYGYLASSHKWFVEISSLVCQWRISKRKFINLPSDILPSLDALPAPRPGVVLPLQSLSSFPMEYDYDGVDAPEVDMDEDRIPPAYTIAPSIRAPAPRNTSNYTDHAYPNYQLIQDISHDLTQYGHHHSLVAQGFVPREGPHPPFYQGPDGPYGGYPGGIFFDRGFDPANWGAEYWGTSSTQGGQAHDDDDDDDDNDDEDDDNDDDDDSDD